MYGALASSQWAVDTRMAKIRMRELRIAVGSGLVLAGDAWGEPEAPPVVLLHGGGQTRHAWGGTARRLAESGFHALAVDLRGHGDSDWCDNGNYYPDHYVEDLRGVMQTFDTPPALVGASLGGMISLLCQGEKYPGTARALVLVDVTPRIEREGVDRIVAFMTARPEGFASLEEAAEAVAEYLPHRRRPRSVEGLERNLRRGTDGRYRWHWDPQFLAKAAGGDESERQQWSQRLDRASGNLTLPTLLVRGKLSDIVSEKGARHFLDLAPHAEFLDVDDATHMVAGDKNDIFADAVVEFLARNALHADSSAA